jgi:hypothetical protein
MCEKMVGYFKECEISVYRLMRELREEDWFHGVGM